MTRQLPVRVGLVATILLSVLAASVGPVGAANVSLQASDGLVVASEHSSATELAEGQLTNAEVVRSGEAGAASHDTTRESAIARYPLDYGSGATAYDHAGSADASLTGAYTWQSDGIDFTGGTLTAPASTVNFGTSNWTLTTTITPQSTDEIVIGTGDDSIDNAVQLRFRSGELDAYVRDSDGTTVGWFGGHPYQAGTTYTVALQRDGDTIRLLVNGDIAATVTDSNMGEISPTEAVTNAEFGQDGDHTLHDFRTYSEALSPGLAHRLAAYPNAKLTPSAADRYAFDAGTGDTAFGDATTTAPFSGTVDWTTGVAGDAISPASQDAYVDVGAAGFAGEDPQEFAIQAWANDNVTDDTGWNYLARLDSRDGTGNGVFAEWGTYSGGDLQFIFKFFNNNGASYILDTDSSADWTHYFVTVNKSSKTVTLYKNASVVASTTYEGTLPDITDVTVGGHPDFDRQWTGGIDEVRTYEFIPSNAGIQELVEHPAAELPTEGSYQAEHVASGTLTAYTDVELQNETATVTVEGYDGTAWTTLDSQTYSTSGNKTLSVDAAGVEKVRTTVDFSRTHPDHYGRVDDEGILFSPHAPNASNFQPANGTIMDSQQATLSVDVTDADFGTAQGDQVDVTFHDSTGTVLGTDTLTSNGTASTTVEVDGTTEWYAVLEDSWGQSVTTATRQFSAPSTLYVRNVSNPSQLIQSGDATVTFYGGEDERTIIERDLSNGTVSLEGPPTDQEFTVVVEADGYHARQVVIKSLYEQSSVFLLPQNTTDVVEVTFRLDDKTGRFSSEDTQLYVQRPITLNNTTSWRTVVADDISASNELATLLVNQQRYRLIVQNENEQRILGAYTPSGPADPEVIPIGEIQIGGDVEVNGTLFGASISTGQNKTDNQSLVRVAYRDPRDATTEVALTVRRENGTVLYQSTTQGPFGTMKQTIPLNVSASADLEVVYNATRDGRPDSSGVVELQGDTCVFCVDALSPQIVNILSAISLLAVMGLVALQDGAYAAATGVVWAFALIIGFGVPITGPAIGLATGYAVVFVVGRGGGA